MLSRLSLLLVTLLFCSCSNLLYSPNQPNLPMVKEKGITKINVATGAGDESSIVDVNAYHSFSNHMGVMLNYSYANMEGNILNSIDGGAGYFNSLGENFGFDVYGLAGYGSLSMLSVDLFSNEELDLGATSLGRFAIQPGIFYSKRNFEAGFGVRLHYLTFGELPELYWITSTREHLMLEPSIKLALGWPAVKLSLQYTYSEKLNSGHMDFDPYTVSIGLTLKFKSKKAGE